LPFYKKFRDENMKTTKNKTKLSAITFILLLTVAAMVVTLPTVLAHDPPLEIPTWAYMSVSPNPIGVGQQAIVLMWLNDYPRTAVGAYGDRWDGYTIEVTAPDGTKETLGPFTSDPVGNGYTNYIPTQVGTYTFVFSFPGDTLTGEPFPPGGLYMGGDEFIGDVYLPSQSDPVTLTVQEEQLTPFQETPLPENRYWTRPINGMNRDWWKVSGNWLQAGDNPGDWNKYVLGPETAHIMWTRQYWDGGIMGGQFGSISYYTSLSYETFGTGFIALNGRLYYNVDAPPRYGWYCVDLRTGEELFFHNTTGPVSGVVGTQQLSGGGFDYSGAIIGDRLGFGQIYDFEAPNQHGGFPYLWSTGVAGSVYGGTAGSQTYRMFDAFTGNYICSVANVSASGTRFYAQDGSILWYNLDTRNDRLTCWNLTYPIWYRDVYDTNQYWMWRPYLNYTFDGNLGFSLNVSIPSDLTGSILAIVEDQYILGGTSGSNDENGIVPGEMWAISLVPGQEGTLLWTYSYTPPYDTAPNIVGGVFGYGHVAGPRVDIENDIFWFTEQLTQKVYVYDLSTGTKLWETETNEDWDYYGMSQSVAYGKFMMYGYGGVVEAFDARTGEKSWTFTTETIGLETFYAHVPLSLACIADGKIYFYSSEHSPSQPLRRDSSIWCIDIETGEEVWRITHWANDPLIADGYLVAINYFDNQIYCYGKGPSATTVTAPDSAQSLGSPVMIRGTVTDQSAGAKGTPAIADEYMTEWMEYLYMQRTCPQNVEGVQVHLTAIDPNNNYQDIGYATADAAGNFGMSWVPPVPGDYYVTATFEGSGAYAASYNTTYFTVEEA
jgi:hypothetical protein